MDAPWTLYLRLADALPFDAPDGKPVRDFLVILVPETGDIDAHLALLAHVASSCGDGDFRATLSAAASLRDVRRGFAGA